MYQSLRSLVLLVPLSLASTKKIEAGLDADSPNLAHHFAQRNHHRREVIHSPAEILRRAPEPSQDPCPQKAVSAAVQSICKQLPHVGVCATSYSIPSISCSTMLQARGLAEPPEPTAVISPPAKLRRQAQQLSSSGRCDQQVVSSSVVSLCSNLPKVGICASSFVLPDTQCPTATSGSAASLPASSLPASPISVMTTILPTSTNASPPDLSPSSLPANTGGSSGSPAPSSSVPYPTGTGNSTNSGGSAGGPSVVSTSNRCGPTSVSTIPGCWGRSACKGYV